MNKRYVATLKEHEDVSMFRAIVVDMRESKVIMDVVVLKALKDELKELLIEKYGQEIVITDYVNGAKPA